MGWRQTEKRMVCRSQTPSLVAGFVHRTGPFSRAGVWGTLRRTCSSVQGMSDVDAISYLWTIQPVIWTE